MSRRIGELCAAALLALAFPALASAAAEVSCEAAVDRDQIALDETVTLQITFQGADNSSSVELPGDNMKDLEVVSREQSTQASLSLNGGNMRMVRSQSFQLVLRPRRAGTLTIPSATCLVGEKRYSTRPITIKVGRSSGGSPNRFRQPAAPPVPDPNDSQLIPPGSGRGSERDLTIKLAVDKKRVWLGEQVTASVILYGPVNVARVSGYRPPSLSGFWSEEIESPSQIRSRIETVDGVPRRVLLLKKLALFPTRSGRLIIDPIEIDALIQVESHDPFDIFPETRQVTRRSEPVAIDVKPLPSDDVPAGFESVNVGQWMLEASVSDTRVAVGQPITYRVEASGTGNIRSLTLPHLAPRAGIRLFDPTAKDQVSIAGDRFGGKKTVETILVPEQPGELILPGAQWHYFDPSTGRYELARTSEIRLEVTPGSASGTATQPTEANTLAAGLRPIRTDSDLSRAGPPPWKTPLFAVLLIGPILAFAGIVLVDRVRDRYQSGSSDRRVRRAGRTARRRLAAARKLATFGESVAFHAEVAHALIGYVGDKLGQAAQGLTRDELAQALARAGANLLTVTALGEALDACDAGRFGMGASTRAEVLLLAEQAMEMLEEVDWKRPKEVA